MIFKIISYSWKIFISLIILLFYLGILGKVEGSFQVIVVSLLVIIYVSMQSYFASFGHFQAKHNLALFSEFTEIKKLFKNPEKDYSGDDEILENSQKEIKAMEAKYWINAVCNSIIYFFALFHLISAVM